MLSQTTATLDAILSTQLLVAWAGEALCVPPRLGWWRTDLIDSAGGGDFLARLLPRTHAWASLEAVREAARRADEQGRRGMAGGDAVRTLFFLGFDLDERVAERLAEHKRATQPPALALAWAVPLAAPFSPAGLAEALRGSGRAPAYDVVPGGRQLKGAMPEAPDALVRTLAAALADGTGGTGGTVSTDGTSGTAPFPAHYPDAVLPGEAVSRSGAQQVNAAPAPRVPPPPPLPPSQGSCDVTTAVPHSAASGPPLPPQPHGEATEVHTGILRLALGVEESRAYWSNLTRGDLSRAQTRRGAAGGTAEAERSLRAFEQRWFGAKSLPRVRTLLSYLAARYDAFPEALAVLHRWREMEPAARQVICHWHTQLSDPLYRRFTGEFLLDRRTLHQPKVDRPAVAKWVRQTYPDRWSEATILQFASKLLSAASEAGLVSAKRDPRSLHFPKVPDSAIAYLLYLLRGLRFEGTLTENAYVTSVGLGDGFLDQRLRTIAPIRLRRMGRLVEIDWQYTSLSAWAEATL